MKFSLLLALVANAAFGGVFRLEGDGDPGLRMERTSDGAFAVIRASVKADDKPAVFSRVRLPKIVIDMDPNRVVTLGSAGLRPVDGHRGSYAFLAVAEPRTRHGVVIAWATSETGSGIVFSRSEGGHVVVEPELQYGKLRLGPGEGVRPEYLLVGEFDDCRLGLEQYADWVARHYAIRLHPQMSGYCTYYSGKPWTAGTEQSTRRFMKEVQSLRPWGFDFYQIDGSWQNGEKSYQAGQPSDVYTVNRRFTSHDPYGAYPNGMTVPAGDIRTGGCVAGLWFMPFSGNTGDSHFDDKHDLFVTSDVDRRRPLPSATYDSTAMNQKAGAPYETFWGGTVLDMTNPKARAYMGANMRRFLEWGYTYFKFDGLWMGMATEHHCPSDEYCEDDMGRQTFFDPKATNVSAFRRGVEFVRETLGQDSFLLACSCSQGMRTMASTYGCVDAMRIGPDNNCTLRGVRMGPIRGTSRYFLNGRVWYNDPDPVYARNEIPVARARLSCTWTALAGNLWAFSDWLPELSEDRIEIFRRTMAPHRLYAKCRPVDLFESSLATTWILSDRGHDIVGLYNWSDDGEMVVSHEAAYVGLDPSATYVGFDFWGKRFIAPFKGRLLQRVAAEDCLVLQVAKLDDRPVLVSTSRHVASPLLDVTDEAWDGRTLAALSRTVPGAEYELRFVMPDGWRTGAFEGVAGAKVVVEGRNVRVVMTPQGDRVAWCMSFARN